MLKINNHIDAIIARCVTDKTNRNYEVDVQWFDDFVSLTVAIPPQENVHQGFERIVVITATDNNQFKVKFRETSNNPQFITQQEERSFMARNEDQLAFACRTVYAHINGKVKPHLIPPEKHIKTWEEINERWLKSSPFCVELFLQGSEWGDDWRFRIKHCEGQEIIGSLDPNTADGHTYSMMTKVAQEFFDRGVIEGEVRAAERIAALMFAEVVEGSQHGQSKYPKDVQALLKNISIRPTNTVI